MSAGPHPIVYLGLLPVVLIGDIDRGGVIASVVGTRAVIEPDDAAMIRGFLINKFRGDPALFEDGYRAIERRSGWPGLGVIPWLSAAARLPSEDAVILDRAADPQEGRKLIACPILPRISNFDDLDPLKLEPGVEVVMVPPGRPIPAEAAMIVLPGSKATIADLAALRAEGWDIDIRAHHRRGGLIVGLGEALAVQFVGAQWRAGVAFAILVAILLVRPTGLFGRQA